MRPTKGRFCMNFRKKILFLDIDDTLLNRKKELTKENEEAIGAALAAGHKIVISTGRPLAAAMATIRRLKLTGEGCYAITYNGGLIWDCFREEAIFKETLPMEDVRYLFARADEEGIHCQTYDRTHVVVRQADEEIESYSTKTGMPFREQPELPEGLEEAPIKVLMIDLHNHQKLADFAASLSPWAKGRVNVFFSNEWYLEMVKEGLSKGSAVRFLADHLGIPMENTIAAGDMENDIPMLEAAHIGCAMANAIDECKAAADYVTERDCDHSGVAEIIRRFLLR